MDEIDIAQRREEEMRADGLAAQARAAGLDAQGAEICADCGEPIPRDRREAVPQAFAERVGRA